MDKEKLCAGVARRNGARDKQTHPEAQALYSLIIIG